MLGRMEDVSTNPKDGSVARYGYRPGKYSRLGCSVTTVACMRAGGVIPALWWAPMQHKGMCCQSGSAHGPRGFQGPLGIPPWLSPSLVEV